MFFDSFTNATFSANIVAQYASSIPAQNDRYAGSVVAFGALSDNCDFVAC
jgi:hypothetical protein